MHGLHSFAMQAPPDEDSSRSAGSGGGGESSGSSQQEPKGQAAQSSLFSNLAQEVKETVMPLAHIRSYTKIYKGPVAETGPYSGSSEIAVVKTPETPWQKAWGTFQEKVGASLA